MTLFAKIISGEIPCDKVYEDDDVLAFLDIAPLAPGHTLIVPKKPAAYLDELDDSSAAAIGRVLPRIARAVMQATGTQAYNVLQNNRAEAHQAVFHVHFHIIPKPDHDSGLGIGWRPQNADRAAQQALAAKIRSAI